MQCFHGERDVTRSQPYYREVFNSDGVTVTHCRLFEKEGMGCPICHTPEMYTLVFLMFCFNPKLL